MIGDFADDYGSHYHITPDTWLQLPVAEYRIERWDTERRYLIAQVVDTAAGAAARWARIDWVELPGMAPYTWAYCYSTWDAPSAAAAESVSVAHPETPKTGCNGFPYSRMQPATSPQDN
jgi:hypothetical protein